MATNVDDKIKKLSPSKRKKVEARTAELIAEEMTLRELPAVRRGRPGALQPTELRSRAQLVP